MNIKEKFTKIKEWVKEHKKAVIGTGLAITVAGIGAAIVGNNGSKESAKVEELPDETDFGRDCTMKFVVNDTQEVLGEVPCTELYAKESVEDYEAFVNNQ